MTLRTLATASILALLAGCGGDVDLGGGGAALGEGGASGSSGASGAAGNGESAAGGGSGSGGVPPELDAKGGQTTTDRIDLLFVVDNSASMADKQALLRAAVRDVVADLAAMGFSSVHAGVITSSLGGLGADSCSPADGSFNPLSNDGGRLIARGPDGAPVPTTNASGFLEWGQGSDTGAVAVALQQMILGAGDVGCGFEQTQEAWYRFLVDPDPYEDVVRVPCSPNDAANGCAEPFGTDGVLLQQREAFLRPDSAVVVVVLSDENDCSTAVGGQNFVALQAAQGAQSFHLPRATAACATSPHDPCCRSCGEEPDPGCPDNAADPVCSVDAFYDEASQEDQINLRCFDQKRRFGIDFLYPTERYVSGLRAKRVPDRDGNLVPNPLYRALANGDATARGRELVFMTGIVGIPWQLVTSSSGALRPATSLDWNEIAGDPGAYEPPAHWAMVESIDERAGGRPSSAASAQADPMNGHEWNVGDRHDLQFTCTFPLLTPLDCGTSSPCDCTGPQEELDDQRKPICQDPSTGQYGNAQHFAKAYPGLRHLDVLRGLGPNAVVAPICPQNTIDPGAADFAMRPAFSALFEKLQLLR